MIAMHKKKDRSVFITFLRLISKVLPGDWLKTAVYRNLVAKPRKAIRLMLDSFYRMDHIYDVLQEFGNTYTGNFSILEFGTADGYAFTKMLYATKYLGMDDRVVVHAFDSFEGLAATDESAEKARWAEQAFKGDYERLAAYCEQRYSNYRIHRGYFESTITDDFLNEFESHPPILVWIDCDYYSSARVVLERLTPKLRSGCVIYFDDYDLNFGSTLTGEAKLVREINDGLFGEDVNLVLDRNLSMNSNRVYRFTTGQADREFERREGKKFWGKARPRSNDSPLP
jgi:hypothetical protein